MCFVDLRKVTEKSMEMESIGIVNETDRHHCFKSGNISKVRLARFTSML